MKISVHAEKNVPLAGGDGNYDRHKVGASIEVEIGNGNPVDEIDKHFVLVNAAIDAQLAIAKPPPQPIPAVALPHEHEASPAPAQPVSSEMSVPAVRAMGAAALAMNFADLNAAWQLYSPNAAPSEMEIVRNAFSARKAALQIGGAK